MQKPEPGQLGRWACGLLLLWAVAGLLCLWAVDPHIEGRYPVCPLRFLTGLACPGCGSLRALHDLLHGNWSAAWRLNPLAMLLLPALLWWLADLGARAFRGRGLRRPWIPARAIWSLLLVILVWTLLRNLIPGWDAALLP